MGGAENRPASYNAKDSKTMAFIYYVTQIQFEFGAVKLLKQECERVGITRPLIVTDPGVKAAGILQKALDALPGVQVAVFDQTPSNPTEAAVRAAAALYKSAGCDGLIAVGGGSAIDCAKGVAIAATHEGPLTTYATIEGGSLKITDRAAPLSAVPTTSHDARQLVSVNTIPIERSMPEVITTNAWAIATKASSVALFEAVCTTLAVKPAGWFDA